MKTEIVTSYERNSKAYVLLEFNGLGNIIGTPAVPQEMPESFRFPRIPSPTDSICETRFKTDKWDKKAEIEKDWMVAYAREITETDIAILTVEVIFGGAAGLYEWISRIIAESISMLSSEITEKLIPEVKEEAIKFMTEVLTRLMDGKSISESTKEINGIGFKAGIAKYSGVNQIKCFGSGWNNTTPPTFSLQPYIGIKKIIL